MSSQKEKKENLFSHLCGGIFLYLCMQRKYNVVNRRRLNTVVKLCRNNYSAREIVFYCFAHCKMEIGDVCMHMEFLSV